MYIIIPILLVSPTHLCLLCCSQSTHWGLLTALTRSLCRICFVSILSQALNVFKSQTLYARRKRLLDVNSALFLGSGGTFDSQSPRLSFTLQFRFDLYDLPVFVLFAAVLLGCHLSLYVCPPLLELCVKFL